MKNVELGHIAVMILHGALFVVSLAGYTYIAQHFGTRKADYAVGFALGTYTLFAKDLANYIWAAIRQRKMPHFHNNTVIQWYMLFVVVVVILVGVGAWYLGWEGRTSWHTGAGVFLALFLYDRGVHHLFDNGTPFGTPA